MSRSIQTNMQQSAHWNDAGGKIWVELQPLLDRVLAPFTPLVVDAGYPGGQGNVLDVGCGAGATTLAMARRLATGSRCSGLDISRALVSVARSRADAEQLVNAHFIEGDAQTFAFDPESFDAVISRFGVMFFDDPVAAFANIRQASKPGGRLAFLAWRSPSENDFFTAPARVAAPFLPPAPPAEPNAPGQFAFADGARVRKILEQSGWSSIEVERADVACEIAEAELMTYATRMGSLGAILPGLDPATANRIKTALRTAFVPFTRGDRAYFTAACWLVTARA